MGSSPTPTDYARPEQALFAFWAVRKIIGVDCPCVNIRIFIRGACLCCILSRCETIIFGGVNGEKGVKWIIVVVLFDTITGETFYIKQTAV